MINAANFWAIAQPYCDEKLEYSPRSTRGKRGSSFASNDNFSCFEQYLFERAVMRELSGDVDF